MVEPAKRAASERCGQDEKSQAAGLRTGRQNTRAAGGDTTALRQADRFGGSQAAAIVGSQDESERPIRFRHSGLDPESSGALLDSGTPRVLEP